MLRYLLVLVISLHSLGVLAQTHRVERFVEKYHEIAIQEMHRTGIPASIKLGQAILESEAGSSELAINSNNFFGLKCGPSWAGATFYKKDDDRDRRGRLIKSCFRAFGDPTASFIEHSEFLRHPAKEYRYGFLFNLDRHDYKSWAWGLKESGYATNPRYAVLLISIIEKYELYSFDYYDPQPERVLVSNRGREKPTYHHPPIEHRTLLPAGWRKQLKEDEIISGLVTNNGLPMVYAQVGDTPRKIADRYTKSVQQILDFNEELTDPDQPLQKTERVYFRKKKKAYRGNKKFHVVQSAETMYDIAQQYGIILEKLYVRNRLFPGSEPAVGEKVKLRGIVKYRQRPKVRTSRPMPEVIVASPPVRKASQTRKHVVMKGDTLYQIASQYQVSLEELKQRNALDSNLIKPGQVLFIGS